MLETVLYLLPALAVAVIINILLGVYNNVGVKNDNFNIKLFISGIIKAIIIACSFIGIAYTFDTIDLSTLGITPDLIVNSAIILYIGKDVQNLIKILGIKNLSIKNSNDNVG